MVLSNQYANKLYISFYKLLDNSYKTYDNEFIFYEILFNGTIQNFINIMKNKEYNLNTQKKIWTIE